MKMVTPLTTALTNSNRCFSTDSAAFGACACFAKMLTPPPQHRVDGVSIWALSGVGGGIEQITTEGSKRTMNSQEGISTQEIRKIILEVLGAVRAVESPRAVDNTELDRLTWLDTREAGRYLRRTANAIRILSCKGILKPRKLGRRLYFRRTELDRVLETSVY